uniref:Uncharacterized protein n=2 Tax=Brassica oleracea TaxID=3712 RepID=A0A0D2ZQT4_BRAOL|nr:unnamed protein product [Brassica oleracea]
MIVENERNGYTQYDISEFEEGDSSRSSQVDMSYSTDMPSNLAQPWLQIPSGRHPICLTLASPPPTLICPSPNSPPALSIPRASFVPNKFSSLGSPWTLPSLPTDSIVSSALVDLLPQVSSTSVEATAPECSTLPLVHLFQTLLLVRIKIVPCWKHLPPIHPPTNLQPNPTSQQSIASPPLPTNWAKNRKKSTDKTLKKIADSTFTPEGIPRIKIPDSVFKKGANLHQDFILGVFLRSYGQSMFPAIIIGGERTAPNSLFKIEEATGAHTYKLTTSSGTVGNIPVAWLSAPQLIVTNDEAKTLFVKFI